MIGPHRLWNILDHIVIVVYLCGADREQEKDKSEKAAPGSRRVIYSSDSDEESDDEKEASAGKPYLMSLVWGSCFVCLGLTTFCYINYRLGDWQVVWKTVKQSLFSSMPQSFSSGFKIAKVHSVIVGLLIAVKI